MERQEQSRRKTSGNKVLLHFVRKFMAIRTACFAGSPIKIDALLYRR